MKGILILLIFIYLLYPSGPIYGLTSNAIVSEADCITFNPTKVIFIASGNAKVKFQGIEVRAGTICVDASSYHLVASEKVILLCDDKEVTCDSFVLNLTDKKGYIYTSQPEELKAEFDAAKFNITKNIEKFPEGIFYMDNILDKDVCITGHELVIHPQDTARIKPAAFWVNGECSMELPFYSFSLGAGSAYTYPRVSYSNLGATVDIPIIISLQENSMSIAHAKYNGDMGISVSLEHQMRHSDNASTVFYLEDLNKAAYRHARMVYRQKFSPRTDATINLDWQNSKNLDVFFNLSQRFSHSIITFNFWTQRTPDENYEGTPTSFGLQWSQNPTDLLGSPIKYAFSAGLNMAGAYKDNPAIWDKTLGLRLTHKPVQLPGNGTLLFGVGDDFDWYSKGEKRNRFYANMTLRLGTWFSIDAYLNRDVTYSDSGYNRTYNYGSVSMNTRFTDKFSARFTYYFNNFMSTYIGEDKYSPASNYLGCFFTYNDSQNFQVTLGTTYDMKNSKFYSAQGDLRFRVGRYFFLTLRPYYDFISKKSEINFQIDPIFGQ